MAETEVAFDWNDLLVTEDDPYEPDPMAIIIELVDLGHEGDVRMAVRAVGLSKKEIIAALETALEVVEEVFDDDDQDD